VSDLRLAMERLLLIGIIISFFLIVLGGAIYLLQHGSDIVNYQHFRGESQSLTHPAGILFSALSLSPTGIIQLGLMTLFFVQILRVFLTTWYFVKEKNMIFCAISMFILLVLVITLLWSF